MWSTQHGSLPPSLEVHLLGQISFADCLRLQRRLTFEAEASATRDVCLLLCEHPPLITVGRAGSRADVRLSSQALARQGLSLVWVGRGGGCVPHAPGQLAIYPIVRLASRGWSVSAYRERLRAGMVQVLERLGLAPQVRPGSPALWGRSGVMATCGLEVQDGVACHGAFLNVDPAAAWLRRVDVVPRAAAAPGARRWMSSLVCERGRPLRMAAVRAEVVAAFADALDCPRFHPHTGHPLLTSPPPRGSESLRRAS